MEIIKHSGERARFSIDKLRNSLRKSGAEEELVQQISNQVRDELYQGISTQEIYNRAFTLLKKERAIYASRYKLKKAIYELGPTGFPFEKFVASLFFFSGHKVRTGVVLQGKCVSHEVDVVAEKDGQYIVLECKFHSEEGRNCDVKIPLYIHSRYRDIRSFYGTMEKDDTPNEGWVATNTRFTGDAQEYGKCAGLHLLSWDYPSGDGLKDRIDRLGLYPITVSTLLSQREKQFLLSRDIVLCRQLVDDDFYLDHLNVSPKRKQRILKEIDLLSQSSR